MLAEVHVAGVLFAPIVLYALAALALLLVLRAVLWRAGFMRLVWNLPLFELALYLCILSLLVLLV
ncbi:DUF1656 domain-containing protein [Lichenicoccus sp.]|uniref:DUF1656 domain-containing protein n=1 Tax=Lichenicoccus sp. TaxID=2781899 RepID=UPI003D0DAA87